MDMTHIAARQARLSSILRTDMGLSAGLVNRLKWQARLLVNGESRHTDYPVQPGDTVTVLLDEPTPNYPAEDLPLSVLYEDEFLLAVDKPAGMLIHPSRSRIEGTLANRVLGYYRRTGQDCAFHPVTRLDRDTFGIVLLAKSSPVHAKLCARRSELEKTYHALVCGAPENDGGVIEAPIARQPMPSLLRCVREDGKPSLTRYTVLERRGECSLLALIPVTGRTHQLRVHCAYAGFPILGDPQYASAASAALSERMGLHSQLLCAHSLTLPHPVSGEILHLQTSMAIPTFP